MGFQYVSQALFWCHAQDAVGAQGLCVIPACPRCQGRVPSAVNLSSSQSLLVESNWKSLKVFGKEYNIFFLPKF